jgi:hypothetical protein
MMQTVDEAAIHRSSPALPQLHLPSADPPASLPFAGDLDLMIVVDTWEDSYQLAPFTNLGLILYANGGASSSYGFTKHTPSSTSGSKLPLLPVGHYQYFAWGDYDGVSCTSTSNALARIPNAPNSIPNALAGILNALSDISNVPVVASRHTGR